MDRFRQKQATFALLALNLLVCQSDLFACMRKFST